MRLPRTPAASRASVALGAEEHAPRPRPSARAVPRPPRPCCGRARTSRRAERGRDAASEPSGRSRRPAAPPCRSRRPARSPRRRRGARPAPGGASFHGTRSWAHRDVGRSRSRRSGDLPGSLPGSAANGTAASAASGQIRRATPRRASPRAAPRQGPERRRASAPSRASGSPRRTRRTPLDRFGRRRGRGGPARPRAHDPGDVAVATRRRSTSAASGRGAPGRPPAAGRAARARPAAGPCASHSSIVSRSRSARPPRTPSASARASGSPTRHLVRQPGGAPLAAWQRGHGGSLLPARSAREHPLRRFARATSPRKPQDFERSRRSRPAGRSAASCRGGARRTEEVEALRGLRADTWVRT